MVSRLSRAETLKGLSGSNGEVVASHDRPAPNLRFLSQGNRWGDLGIDRASTNPLCEIRQTRRFNRLASGRL
jgi:hypothetical protein